MWQEGGGITIPEWGLFAAHTHGIAGSQTVLGKVVVSSARQVSTPPLCLPQAGGTFWVAHGAWNGGSRQLGCLGRYQVAQVTIAGCSSLPSLLPQASSLGSVQVW